MSPGGVIVGNVVPWTNLCTNESGWFVVTGSGRYSSASTQRLAFSILRDPEVVKASAFQLLAECQLQLATLHDRMLQLNIASDSPFPLLVVAALRLTHTLRKAGTSHPSTLCGSPWEC